MKKSFAKILASAMIFSIVASLFCISASAADYNYLFPVKDGIIKYYYGYSSSYGSDHTGIDIHSDGNDTIYAAKAGVVEKTADSCEHVSYGKACEHYSTYGNYIRIKHSDGTKAYYGHLFLGSLLVKEGDSVKKGQAIAKMGSSGYSTGKHLHFELRNSSGSRINVNPTSKGGKITYSYSGYITCSHNYTDSSPYVCTKCKAWKSSSLESKTTLSDVQYKVINSDAVDRAGPYGNCRLVNEYSSGNVVTAVQKIVNGYGNTWYKLSNGYYIFGDYVEKYNIDYADIAEGIYYIKNVSSGRYLAVSGGSDKDGQNIRTLEKKNSDSMKFRITKASKGYEIMPLISKTRVLNPYANSVKNWVDINLYKDSNDSSQRWRFDKDGDYYVIRNVQNSSCVITSTKGSDYEVFVRDYKGSKTQKWVLEPLVDTHTHDWYGGAVTKVPSCAEEGEITYVCTICSAVKTETLPTAEHDWYGGAVTKVPTCTQEGELTYVCTICSAVKTETLPPTGHDWDEGMITRHPTAEEDGEIVYVCKKCNESRYEVIEKGENLKGDMNSDGKITAADARILLRISARLEPSDDSIIKKGDINNDGKITAADARKIIRVAAKVETIN